MGTKRQAQSSRPLAAVVLAAGRGTRMKTRLPKVVQPICSRPLIEYVLAAVRPLDPTELRVVVGYGADHVKAVLGDSVAYSHQRDQRGTADAVLACAHAYGDFDGDLLVVSGDQPRITAETLGRLVAEHRNTGAAATLLTSRMDDPTGYGRILRSKNGQIRGIVEDRDCTHHQRRIREVNTTMYVFRAPDLFEALQQVDTDNAQGELYLTDVIGIFAKARRRVASVEAPAAETAQVSNQADLARMTAVFRDEINAHHMAEGVTIIDPPSTFIGPDVQIGPDTIVYPNTQIEGSARIGEDCRVGPNTYIDEADVGKRSVVVMSYVSHCVIREEARIGPFTHIRPESIIGRGARVGNFVEVKKAVLAEGVKASHLTYLGDATIGPHTNIGAGTITANYDGHAKHETHIGANNKVGAGTIFVAPVAVGDDVVTGAGAVVMHNQVVPDHTTLVGVPAVALRPGQDRKRTEAS